MDGDVISDPATNSAAIEQLFGFTGQERDKEAGLENYNARWYDPAMGRFISKDPSGFDGGDANLYRYVGNDPINYTDPTGLFQAGNPVQNLTGFGNGVFNPYAQSLGRIKKGSKFKGASCRLKNSLQLSRSNSNDVGPLTNSNRWRSMVCTPGRNDDDVEPKDCVKKQLPHAPVASQTRVRAVVGCVSLVVFTVSPLASIAVEGIRPAGAYPEAASKKGLQVELLDDALALGIKHAAINVNLSQLVAPNANQGSPAHLHWSRGQRTFSFHLDRVEQLDHTIKSLSSHGVVVHLIILVYESDQAEVNRIVLHPNYDHKAPNRMSAFNAQTAEGREWLSATMEFLAQRWSRPDQQYGRVAGYILGNEVNSHWWWSNMGRATMSEFADNYWLALRIVHRAVRQHLPWARVYISLEHHWNIRISGSDDHQAFAGKEFINYLARRTREDKEGNFDWHVAFHPYPENLFEPRFWNDKTALSNPETPRITFKNIEVLTEYLRRPELLYEGKPRRVILSEQGFHTPDGPTGEAIQAAAYCYAYRKIARLDGIDAFILHRHVDHPHEDGLRLGLRRYLPAEADPRPAKMIYECFRHADQPDWEETFRFALPIIGIQRWSEVDR